MKIKVIISEDEFNQIGLEGEELQYAISKMLGSSYDCDNGDLLLGFDVDQYDVDLEVV